MMHPVAGKSTLAALAVVVALGGAVLLTLHALGVTETVSTDTAAASEAVLAPGGPEAEVEGDAMPSAGDAAEAVGALGPEVVGADASGGAEAETESDAASSAGDSREAAGPQIVEADAFTLPYRDLEIAAEIGGVVAFVDVEEGELVEEGQVLVRFKSDLLEARRLWQQAQVASAVVQISAEQTRCEVATQECDRMAGLFEKEVISDRDYVQARLEKDLADWRVRAAEAAVTASEAAVVLEEKRIEQTIVRAPIDGQILRIAKRPGEAVEVYNPMLQMVRLDPLYVVGNVPIDTFGRIRPGMKAVLDVPHLKRPLACEVVVVDNVADVGSGLYRVKLTLPNPDGSVTAGALGTLRFELDN